MKGICKYMNANPYSANNLKLLKGLEPVRSRPGMYIGSTDINGLHHLVWEILDNSVDEANAGFGSKIEVDINTDGSISISDEGRGVPCDLNKQEGMSGFDMVYRTLHAGGKFDSTNYKTAGGLHGVGGAVVNALSSYMEIHSYRNGQDNFIRYEDGGSKQTKIEVKSTNRANKSGTKVTFLPDKKVFEDTTFDFNKISASLDDRACLSKGVTFILNDKRSDRKQEFCYKEGIKEYFITHNFGKKGICEPIYITGESSGIIVEIVGQFFFDSYSESITSFANSVRTIDGGHHVVGLKRGLTATINKYAQNHNLLKGIKAKSLDGNDIREGFHCILSVWVPENILEFEGQTKSKLGTRQATQAVDDVIQSTLSYYLEEHSADANAIVEKTISSMTARLKAKEAKNAIRKANSKSGRDLSNLSGKLTPCSTKQYTQNELFIVEGDSAGGSAKKCRDRKHQAILPLRGKPKNVVGSTNPAEIYDNTELNTIIYTIGAGCDEDFNIKNMHYDKVIIMTDADDDGCHIQNLLISFFYEHMRPLIEEGHLYIACPPFYRVFTKKKEIYCWSDEDLDKARNIMKKGYLLSRYKGLGEMNADQLGQTTMARATRRLIRVVIEDEDDCTDKLNLFMNKNSADRRKVWIENNIDFTYRKDHFEEIKDEK